VSDVAAAAVQPAPPSGPLGFSLWSKGGFSFKDLVDIVNPLQHLPVVGSIYRYLTGDEPAGGTRIIGDALYGGPIGFGVSVVSTALLTDASGHDLGERLLAAVFGSRDGDSPTLGTPSVAAAPTAPTAVAATPAGQAALAPAAKPAAAQPVAMNQLFRSPPAAAPASTPEQSFIAQNSQLQRQISSGRGSNGAVINNRPVPLELSSHLLPVMPAGGHLSLPAATSAGTAAPAQAPKPGDAAIDPNPIAQKMLDALSKYEQLKRQEKQEDKVDPGTPSKLDLSL
jgi:hypothetical protein